MKTKLFIILFLFSFTIYGQESTSHHYIGVGAGFTTGSGLSYRFLENNYGVQLNFAPYYEKNVHTYINGGLTLLYKVTKTENSNILLYYANCMYYTNDITIDNAGNRISDAKNRWNTGFGVDFEFNSSGIIVFNLMAGFASYDSFDKIFPTIEGAVYYKIK